MDWRKFHLQIRFLAWTCLQHNGNGQVKMCCCSGIVNCACLLSIFLFSELEKLHVNCAGLKRLFVRSASFRYPPSRSGTEILRQMGVFFLMQNN